MIYLRIHGGYTDRGDHIDTIIGHRWIKGSNPIQAKCGRIERSYSASVHHAQEIRDPIFMCDQCWKAQFNMPIPEYGDLMTTKEFLGGVECGGYTDDDGYGHPSNGTTMDDTIQVFPSGPFVVSPETTHIVWFNK